MTRDEALRVLGLPATATDAEIQARFRELAPKFHPDTGGDAEAIVRLYMARDIALRQPSSVALVPADELQAMMRKAADTAVKRYEAGVTKSALIGSLRRRRTSSLRSMKQVTVLLGFFSAFLGLTSDFLSATSEVTGETVTLGPHLLLMAVAAGGLYVVLSRKVEATEQRIQELGQALLDRAFYLDLLKRILPSERHASLWTKRELIFHIDAWPAPEERRSLWRDAVRFYADVLGVSGPDALDTASGLPSDELAVLLITSGLERDVLEEVEIEEHGTVDTAYRIKSDG